MSDETSDPNDPNAPNLDELNERLAEFQAPDDAEDDREDGEDGEDGVDDHDVDDVDAIAQAEAAMAEARRRLASVPAEVVVTNHAMGLYELAAIHLSAEPPDLGQAALAIDAVACLVDGLGDRMGPDAATMRDALNNIRLAFVQIKGRSEQDG